MAELPEESEQIEPGHDREADDAQEAISQTSQTATKLILADLAMRAGTTLLRKGVERGILGGEPLDKAEQELAKKDGRGKRIAAKAGKLASKSAPVAAAVAGGFFVKNLFDRSQRVRAKRYGTPSDEDQKAEG